MQDGIFNQLMQRVFISSRGPIANKNKESFTLMNFWMENCNEVHLLPYEFS